MSTEEGSHTTDDGQKLYTKTWKTDGPAKARLVFIHGFSDHCNTYDNFFPALAAKGIEVYTFDQRGWGRSVTKRSERGLTGPTTRVLGDITSFIKSVIPSPVPLFLMGNSMGGQEVLCWVASGPADVRKHIRGFILEAPFIDFNPKSKPSSLTIFFGRLAGRLLPHRQLVNQLEPTFISRDPAICKMIADDELCHDTGTLEGLAGMLDRTNDLACGKITFGDDRGEDGVTRILFCHGDGDNITNYGATKAFCERLQVKDKEFKTYTGHYHRLHDEPDTEKNAFINDVADWILARSAEPVQAEGAKSKL